MQLSLRKERQLPKERKPDRPIRPKRMTFHFRACVTRRTRSMYYQDAEDAKEDENASTAQQRDVEVYASLKQAIQSRFFDILLNWDLFVPA